MTRQKPLSTQDSTLWSRTMPGCLKKRQKMALNLSLNFNLPLIALLMVKIQQVLQKMQEQSIRLFKEVEIITDGALICRPMICTKLMKPVTPEGRLPLPEMGTVYMGKNLKFL